MISERHGNLLEAPVDALVNTVNTVGVMGKGTALQFRPANKAEWSWAECSSGTAAASRTPVLGS